MYPKRKLCTIPLNFVAKISSSVFQPVVQIAMLLVVKHLYESNKNKLNELPINCIILYVNNILNVVLTCSVVQFRQFLIPVQHFHHVCLHNIHHLRRAHKNNKVFKQSLIFSSPISLFIHTSSTCACVCCSRFCAAICCGVLGPPTTVSSPAVSPAPVPSALNYTWNKISISFRVDYLRQTRRPGCFIWKILSADFKRFFDPRLFAQLHGYTAFGVFVARIRPYPIRRGHVCTLYCQSKWDTRLANNKRRNVVCYAHKRLNIRAL